MNGEYGVRDWTYAVIFAPEPCCVFGGAVDGGQLLSRGE